MKGKIVLLVVLLAAAAALYFVSLLVAENAAGNADFQSLYRVAMTVRSRQPLYDANLAPAQAVEEEEEAEAEAPIALAGVAAAEPAGEVEDEALEQPPVAGLGYLGGEAVAEEEEAPAEAVEDAPGEPAEETLAPMEEAAVKPSRSTGFRLAPYVGLILLPLAYIEPPTQAITVFYWVNVALLVVSMMLASYVISGKPITARMALLVVPGIAIIPFLTHFLTGASLAVLALTFVLAGLALFRNKLDVAAGLVSSIAAFSPLGIAIGAYWFLKRSWKAGIAFLVGAAALLVVAPMATLGPLGALAELRGFAGEAVIPYFRLTAEAAPMEAADNQSMWAVLMRNTTHISDLTVEVSGRVEKFSSVSLADYTQDYMAVVLFAVGAIVLVASVFGVWRRLLERKIAVVGLEGALVVLATLVMSFRTTFDTMVVLLFPLMAAVYVIQNTELRRLVHHINYVGLVVAIAFFYMALDPRFMNLGIALLGEMALWVALLAAIYRFRPRVVHGRMTTSFEAGGVFDKPIPVAEVHSEVERKPKDGKGLLPLPEFAKRHGEGRVMTEREDREMPEIHRTEPIKISGGEEVDEGLISLDEMGADDDDVRETDSPLD